ncbi:IclR family transcriptional regulator [Salinactinospora qingdaonensis]|uniref:IclR family transcriptional regulator n=1 Tax=Salinactinospora qingdaonensis TaxID=702744 RepID=A0ABP7FF91_9ACTN
MRAGEWNDPRNASAAQDSAAPSVIARSSALLGAFGPGDHTLGVSELARRTGLAKSTVHRLARELTAHGLLERDGGGLRLGLRLFELGQLVRRRQSLREAAWPFMTDLCTATGATAQLAVLDGTEVVYLEILVGSDAPDLPSRVGGRLPAHATAVGKAILAFSPAVAVDEVLRGGLVRLSSRTIVTPGRLRRELATIREAGMAYDREESGLGIVCAAVPVIGPEGTAVAALSVSGWSGRLRLPRIAAAVHTAGLALSRSHAAGPG